MWEGRNPLPKSIKIYIKKYNNTYMNKFNNVIVLRSTYRALPTYFFNPMKDPKTGRFPDCVRRVDSKGDMIMSEDDRNNLSVYPLIAEDAVIKVVDGTSFNLDDPYDKAKWEAIKHCPLIVAARDAKDKNGNLIIDGENAQGKTHARYGIAELYIEHVGAEAVKRVSKKEKIHEAYDLIINDEQGSEGRRLKCEVLGRNMTNVPEADVKDFLFNIAEKDYKKIIDLYTGGDMGIRLMFLAAKKAGVIINKDKLYIYGDEPLGATDTAVIAWLKDPVNRKKVELIKREIDPEFDDTEGETDQNQELTKQPNTKK